MTVRMDKHQQVIDLDIVRDAGEALRMMGCGPNGAARPATRDLVNRLLAETQELVRPRAAYLIREVERMTENRLDLRGCHAVRGPIAKFLKPAKRVAVFIVTIGDELEKLATGRMEKGRTLEGYALDAIGSAAADAAVDALADHILWNDASPDEAVSPALSPGYCGLPLDEQVPLFSILNSGAIGVRLLPSMIMYPIKSVSGLLGIGGREEVVRHGVPCEWCELDDCKMRRLEQAGS